MSLSSALKVFTILLSHSSWRFLNQTSELFLDLLNFSQQKLWSSCYYTWDVSTKSYRCNRIKLLATGCFKKNATMFVCLISPEPMSRFLNRFFLLKTEIHMKILNTEPIFYDFRGLRYLQNKTAFWSKQVHIHFVLKWSSQHQSGLEMPWLAPYWPGHSLRGLQGPQAALTGL